MKHLYERCGPEGIILRICPTVGGIFKGESYPAVYWNSPSGCPRGNPSTVSTLKAVQPVLILAETESPKPLTEDSDQGSHALPTSIYVLRD